MKTDHLKILMDSVQQVTDPYPQGEDIIIEFFAETEQPQMPVIGLMNIKLKFYFEVKMPELIKLFKPADFNLVLETIKFLVKHYPDKVLGFLLEGNFKALVKLKTNNRGVVPGNLTGII